MIYSNDNIILFYEKNKLNIFYKLYVNPEKQILYYDHNCKKKCLKNNNYDLYQICYGCKLISSFLKNQQITENISTFRVNFGQKMNYNIKFNRYKLFSPHYIKKESRNNYYITYDKYYNLTIINIITSYIQTIKKIKLNAFLWGYICDSNIVNLSYVPDFKNLKELCYSPIFNKNYSPFKKTINTDILATILKMLLIYLDLLFKYNYSHGDPIIQYISFSHGYCKYNYNGFNIDSNLILHLDNSIYSSIGFHKKKDNINYKFCFNNLYILKNNFFILEKKNFMVGFINDKQTDIIKCYKIGSRYENFKDSYRQGLCSEYNSFDFVCFMISLLLDKSFFKFFMNSNYVIYWKRLWTALEYKLLEKDINDFKGENTFDEVLNIVKNYYIRYDAFYYFYNSIKNDK